MTFGGIAFQLPGAVRPPATQIDDRLQPLTCHARNIARGGLRRPPQVLANAMLVEMGNAQDAVIDKQQVQPGAQAFTPRINRTVPARLALETPPFVVLIGVNRFGHGAALAFPPALSNGACSPSGDIVPGYVPD